MDTDKFLHIIILGFYSDKLLLVLLIPGDDSKWWIPTTTYNVTKRWVSQGRDKNDEIISASQRSEVKGSVNLSNRNNISHDK